MKTRPCKRTPWVLKAIAQDQLEESPELFAHYQACEPCQRAALRAEMDLLSKRISEAMREEDDLLGAEADPVAPRPARRMARWPLIAAAATALLAIGIGIGVDRGPAPDVRPDDLSTAARGKVSLTLATTEGRCDTPNDAFGHPPRAGTADPCIYPLGTELTLNLRVEPDAPARYLAVFARDAAGAVEVLFSNAAPGDEPLPVTGKRVSDRCEEDICWLEGGHYDVLPGTLHVVAVFSDGPLPVDEMSRDWAPEKWAGPRTFIERFEVSVRPKGERR